VLLALAIAYYGGQIVQLGVAAMAFSSLPPQDPLWADDCGSGQFDVVGTVGDETGKPIPGARIQVYVTELGCENSQPGDDLNLVSDGQGHFQGVREGITSADSFEIAVSAEGYETYRKAYIVHWYIRSPEAKGLRITLTGSGEWF
jgi:hypothetical protein